MSLYPRVPNRRGSLLDPLDSGGFSTPEPSFLSALTAPVGPGGVNRSADVGRVENLLGRSGDLAPKARAARGLFDPPVEAGVRAFQVRRGLKPDGLLNPGGPTETALVRQAAQLEGLAPRSAPPRLPGLSGEGAASNARSVRHLAATRENGLFPDLLTQDARAGGGDRSLAVDFFAQLRRADYERAEQIRREMALDPEEDRTFFADVDKWLEAETFDETTRRLADGPRPLGDADDNDDDGGIGTPPDDGDDGDGDDGDDDGDDGEENPPYDPDHPEPGDPDDPDEPEEPEPDCSDILTALQEVIQDLHEVIDEKRAKQAEIASHKLIISRLKDKRRTVLAHSSPSAPPSPDVSPIPKGRIGRVLYFAWRALEGLEFLNSGYRNSEAVAEVREIDADIAAERQKIDELRKQLEDVERGEENLRQLEATLEERLRACRAGRQ